MKIRFVRKFKPAGDAPDIPTYKAGEVYDLAEGYAKKYVARGWAVEYKDEPAPVVVEEPKEEPKQEPVVEVVAEEPKAEAPAVQQPRQQINFKNSRRHGR